MVNYKKNYLIETHLSFFEKRILLFRAKSYSTFKFLKKWRSASALTTLERPGFESAERKSFCFLTVAFYWAKYHPCQISAHIRSLI